MSSNISLVPARRMIGCPQGFPMEQGSWLRCRYNQVRGLSISCSVPPANANDNKVSSVHDGCGVGRPSMSVSCSTPSSGLNIGSNPSRFTSTNRFSLSQTSSFPSKRRRCLSWKSMVPHIRSRRATTDGERSGWKQTIERRLFASRTNKSKRMWKPLLLKSPPIDPGTLYRKRKR